tara:strand:- start:8201 stop:9295 length:1095 start_codon:yes stop_codon:yes gene_type:complete
MAQVTKINVKTTSQKYLIHIGEGLVKNLNQILNESGSSERHVVISSQPIWSIHGSEIQTALGKTDLVLIPDGETAKNLNTIATIYESLIKLGADRSTTIIAVGGGVLGDVAGFAAASFLRGIRLVHIPTTLLAQVDSSIGGKVGVNHQLGKNLIGAFHQPIAVIADPLFLQTLPRREFRAGLYEIVKYGVIASQSLFTQIHDGLDQVFDRKPEVLSKIIAESCQIKADVVSKDERESGIRRILNFGHTVGHAIEAVTEYRRFRHGEAVAYGMLAASYIAMKRDLFSSENHAALFSLISQMGPLPSVSDLSISALLKAIHRDKKIIKGKLHMVLPIRLGETTIVNDLNETELREAIVTIGVPKGR